MNKLDKKILRELDEDPRISLTQLGKKLRISKQRVDYRIKRLKQNGTILGLNAIVNPKKLGLEHYRLFIKLRAGTSMDEMARFLQNTTGVLWAASIGGQYDLHIALLVYDFEDHDNFLDELNKKFPGAIRQVISTYGLEYSLHTHKYLGSTIKNLTYNSSETSQIIDKTDHEILKAISKDCRESSVKLGKAIGVSYKTVLQRIKKMKQSRIILGYRLSVKDKEKSTYLLLLKFGEYNKQEENKLANYVLAQKQVTQSTKIFGQWNILLHLRAESPEKAQQILIELRERFGMIQHHEIMPLFQPIVLNLYPVKKISELKYLKETQDLKTLHF